MNRVKNITLSNFRAFEGTLDLDFRLESNEIADIVVIHAPNGMGKTSVFDGVEWGLTGSIHRLDETIGTDCQGTILKNRKSEANAEAFVKIECESGEYVKRSTNRRSQNTDYNKGTVNKGRKLTEYDDWGAMILPHSRIDGFVAATNPEAKFDEWGRLWDSEGKSRDTFRFISGLKRYTDIKITKIAEEISILTKIVKDLKIEDVKYNEINKTIDKVNKVNEYRLSKISNEYDYDSLYNLQVDIMSLIERQKVELDKLSSNARKAVSLKNKIEVYYENMKFISGYNGRLGELNKRISEIQEFISNEKKFIEVNKKVVVIRDEIRDFNELTNAGESWILNKSRNDYMKKALITNNKRLNEKKKAFENIGTKILQCSKQKEEIHKKIVDLNNIYRSFISKLDKLDSLKLSIGNTDREIAILNKDKKSKEDKCFKLRERLNSIKCLKLHKHADYASIRDRAEENGLNKLVDLDSIICVSNKLNLQEKELLELQEKQRLIEKSISIHEQIVVQASNWIEENHSKTCPVCNAEYIDYEILINKIKGNFKNEVLQEDNTESINKCQKQIEYLNTQLKDIIIHWNKQIEYIQNEMNEEIGGLVLSIEKCDKQINDLRNHADSFHKVLNEENGYYYRNGLTTESIISNETIREWYNSEHYDLITTLKIIEEDCVRFIEQRNNIEEEMNVLNIKNNLINGEIDKYNSNLDNKKYHDLYTKHRIDFSYEVVKESLDLKKEELQKLLAQISELESVLDSDVNFSKDNLELLIDEKSGMMRKMEHCNDATMQYKEAYSELIASNEVAIEELEKVKLSSDSKITEIMNTMSQYTLLKELVNSVEIDRTMLSKRSELQNHIEEKKKLEEAKDRIDSTYSRIKEEFKASVSRTFNDVLSNDIFMKIEAHPVMNKIEFDITLSDKGSPELRIQVSDKDNHDQYLPEWYFSSAQLNALALSVFLSKAISKKDAPINTLFIDDPIGHFDDINVISFIDVIRSINEASQFQIILSTHDESIYKLLKMKLPGEYYRSKFIDLTKLVEESIR